MIKNIIFDFGDIFINLDKEVIFREIEKYGGNTQLTQKMYEIAKTYEVGNISSEMFVAELQSIYPTVPHSEIIRIWNSTVLDFPDYRLDFIENFAKENTCRLFLLSNTNTLHMQQVVENMGVDKFKRFKGCFEQFYLSHELNLRKPDDEIFEFVLGQNGLKATETLFIDDTKENIDAANDLGIRTWHLKVGLEDVIDIKTKL